MRAARLRIAAVVAVAMITAACSSASAPGSASKTGTRRHGSMDPDSFTIAATGDFLIHDAVAREAHVYGATTGQAYDFRPMTSKIKPLISSADLAICHVETPMSATDTGITGYPVFNTPQELADAIKYTGYDGCSVASNHTLDRGLAGVSDTLGALDRVGVEHAGAARSAAEADQIEIHQIKGVAIAHLSYTFGTNTDTPIPADEPWVVNVTNVPTIIAAAHRAKQLGARFVVVSMHWGSEYQVAPTAEQRLEAHELLASTDIDLILGDHAHVLQPVEKIGDKYVVYGLGNILSNQSPAAGLPASTEDGAIVEAHVHRIGNRFLVDRVTYTPTYVQIGPYTIWPVAAALDDPSTPATLRLQLAAAWRRTVAIESSLPGHAHDATPGAVPHRLP